MNVYGEEEFEVPRRHTHMKNMRWTSAGGGIWGIRGTGGVHGEINKKWRMTEPERIWGERESKGRLTHSYFPRSSLPSHFYSRLTPHHSPLYEFEREERVKVASLLSLSLLTPPHSPLFTILWRALSVWGEKRE